MVQRAAFAPLAAYAAQFAGIGVDVLENVAVDSAQMGYVECALYWAFLKFLNA